MTAIMTPAKAKKLFAQKGTTKENKPKKYKNKECNYEGIHFDSIKEKNRYIQLKLLERAGKIKDLRLQVKFQLLPTTRICGKTQPKTSYTADFVYWDNLLGREVVEDVKGVKTAVYQIKRKLMMVQHGIEVVEI